VIYPHPDDQELQQRMEMLQTVAAVLVHSPVKSAGRFPTSLKTAEAFRNEFY
jgi:hypothetical protein